MYDMYLICHMQTGRPTLCFFAYVCLTYEVEVDLWDKFKKKISNLFFCLLDKNLYDIFFVDGFDQSRDRFLKSLMMMYHLVREKK